MQADQASQQRLPDDVLLSVAEYLAQLVPPEWFARLLAVHHTFLHVGMLHRYGKATIDCSERSVRFLHRIRSEPLLASRVRTLAVQFYAARRSSRQTAQTSRIPGSIFTLAQGPIFVNALRNAMPSLTRLLRLEITWSKSPDGLFTGTTSDDEADSETLLSTMAPALTYLWTAAAPLLKELRVDLYTDALKHLPILDGSIAVKLAEVDVRIFGSLIRSLDEASAVGGRLAEVSHHLLLPIQDQLEAFNVCVAQRGSPPHVISRGFFSALSSTRFLKLQSMNVEVAFYGGVFFMQEDSHLADFLATRIRSGRLRSLVFQPVPYSNGVGFSEVAMIPSYKKFLQEHGGKWGGLSALSVCIPELRTSRRMTQAEDGGGIPFLLPLLSVSSSLEELTFTGQHFDGVGDLCTALEAIRSAGEGSRLRKLTVKINTIRPSVLDELASSAPSLQELHLEVIRALPDGPPPSYLVDELQAEEEAHTTIDPLSIHHNQGLLHKRVTQQERAAARTRLLDLAKERTFMTEMELRQYDSWALRRATVYSDPNPYRVAGLPAGQPPAGGPAHVPRRDAAALVMDALRCSVPGIELCRDSTGW